MSGHVNQRGCIHRMLRDFIDMPRGPLAIQNWDSSVAGIGIGNLSNIPDDAAWIVTWTADDGLVTVESRAPEEALVSDLVNQRDPVDRFLRGFGNNPSFPDDVARILTPTAYDGPATVGTHGNGGSEGESAHGTGSSEDGRQTGSLFRLDEGPVETLREDGYIYGEAQCTLRGEWNGTVKLEWLCGWDADSSLEGLKEDDDGDEEEEEGGGPLINWNSVKVSSYEELEHE